MSRRTRSFMSSTRLQAIVRQVDQAADAFEMQPVVDHGGEQVVGRRDRVQVAREMQVDVVAGDDPGQAAAGRPTLHPEDRAQGGLAQGDDGRACRGGRRRPPARWRSSSSPRRPGVGVMAVTMISFALDRQVPDRLQATDLGFRFSVFLQTLPGDPGAVGDLLDRLRLWEDHLVFVVRHIHLRLSESIPNQAPGVYRIGASISIPQLTA